MSDPTPEQDEAIRRKVINLLAHDMLLKDHANLKKDCEAYLLKRGETSPEMVAAAMLTVCRAEAEATLYKIFGTGPGDTPERPGNKQGPPAAESGEPENVFLDYTNKPGEPLSWWSESLEDIIGPEEEEEEEEGT
jgi:hypothetical protein